MASSEGSAHSQWRSFFASLGATAFQVIDAAVAVAALDCPAELEQRREGIVQRLYTEDILSCSVTDDSNTDSTATPVSKKEDGPSARSTEKATAPVKNELARKNCSVRPHPTKPPAADLDRNQPSAQSMEMEAKLATTKRILKERYDEHKEAKRQRKTPMLEAPEMARQRRKTQHHIIRRRDEVRCTATIAERRALMSHLRASWA